MGLTEYKRKRHFNRTPEPSGKWARKAGWSYVVQKHDASRLHYDFRLELDGVLKSWAVPKGPSLDPKQKRLAVHVEDHPVDYGRFEGIIPAGEYGGGTVLLWDQGHWAPVGDPREGYRSGKLKFVLHGEKLHGGWMLVRTASKSARDQKNWLLIKERDDQARPVEEGDVLEEAPLSVVSRRDLEEIAHAADRDLEGAKTGKLPTKIKPQLATLAKEAPDTDLWLHEIKFDGYRMVCRIDHGRVEFISRNQQSWTSRLAPLVQLAQKLPVRQAILDGEVVAMEPGGTTDFQALQNAFREGGVRDLLYYVFDLLHFDGRDLTKVPLEERKRVLAELLSSQRTQTAIRCSEHMLGNGPEFFKQACQHHLEGIISKRRDRAYSPGRGYDWLKIKCVKTEELVIGGYTDPGGSRTSFGALLLGYYKPDKKLVYAGKVGTGFDARTLADLMGRLGPLEQDKSPFSDLQGKTGAARGAHWVKPQLVAQIKFGNWTRDGLLRHPSFQGLREDKPASEVSREKPMPVKMAIAASGAKLNGKSPRKTPSGKASQRRGGASNKTPRLHDTANEIARKDEFAGVRLTSPDKVLYPDEGITKLDLAKFYVEIADWILPHVANRPLVLVRCPEGQQKACFYQKHPGLGTPKNLRQIPVREKSKLGKYLVVDDASGLISLAQVGALELHVWGSRADNIEQPDRLIFDLDPDPQVRWNRVVESAQQIREFLAELGLVSFVKTTGGKGLHLVVPIQRRHDWNEVKEFCKQVAKTIVRADPQRYTSKMSKAARSGKIFIDYLRNGRGATSVAPYSTRARPGAPVSTPLAWEELSVKISSEEFNVRNLRKRLAALARDPWEGIQAAGQSLSASVRKKLGRAGS